MGVYNMAVDIYSKTAWVNGTAPSLSKTQLDHIETGIKNNNTAIISLQSVQVECENYASEALASKIASASSATASASSALSSLAEANRAESIVDDAITSAVSASISASTSASLIAIQPSVDASEASATASEASASNAFISESNADLSETACLNYKNIMQDAIDTNIPTFSFNPLNGHLEYTGGTINFSLNTEKHLLWEVQL
jgi:hypothetical protein